MNKIAPIMAEEMHIYWKYGQTFHLNSRYIFQTNIDI